MKPTFLKAACCFTLISILTACGGGSGTDSAAINFPVNTAITSFLAQPSTYILNANASGDNLRLTSSFSPRADEVEPNLSPSPLSSYLLTESLSVNNGPAETDSSIGYYSENPFEVWGGRSEYAPGQYSPAVPATSRTPMPFTATVGQSGFLGAWPDGYYDANGNFVEASETLSWTLERATGDTAWLCLESAAQDTDGTYAINRCMRINQSGTTVGYKVDVRTPYGALGFR